MDKIVFDDSLKVNIPTIDGQHARLIDMLNQLIDYKAGQVDVPLAEVLSELAAYVDYHFATEEDLFEEYQYPQSEVHKAEHQSYTQKLADFNAEYEKDQTIGLPDEIITFLFDWIKHHIQVVDRQYAPFLLEKGVQ